MATGDLDKIYSNDYADFFINYNGDVSVLEQYRESGVNIINFFLAVTHLPVSVMTEDVISKMGYAPIPSLFGLVTQDSLESSGIPQIRSVPDYDLRGNGVLIGFVDSGIDYTNAIFQNEDRTTRIASLWDQTIRSDQIPDHLVYGTEYSREQINEAIKNADPFSIVPSKDEIGHGTMVAGIAAGRDDLESGFYGIATESELVVVKLKTAKPYLKKFFRLPEDAITYQETDIIFGIQYLLDYAAKVNKPIVICIALDTSQYAHDGRGTTSSWLSFEASMPGTAVLTCVGNEGNSRRHYFGVIEEVPGYDTVELNVGSDESGFSMELWGVSPNVFTIDILSPAGEYVQKVNIRYNQTQKVTFTFSTTVIYIDNQLVESQSGDQLILLRFSNPSQGIWKFRVYGIGIFPLNYNIWLPMNHFIKESTFFNNSNPYTTLLSLSCSSTPIAVTAYNHVDQSLYLNAGRGYTRINLIKPDIAAPGVNVLSPDLKHGFVEITGTSAAVAHTAGVAAMMFEWGIVKGNYPRMSTQDLKVFMIRGARRIDGIQYPNQEWGYGMLDMVNIFKSLVSGRNE